MKRIKEEIECPIETCDYEGPPSSVEAHITATGDGDHEGAGYQYRRLFPEWAQEEASESLESESLGETATETAGGHREGVNAETRSDTVETPGRGSTKAAAGNVESEPAEETFLPGGAKSSGSGETGKSAAILVAGAAAGVAVLKRVLGGGS